MNRSTKQQLALGTLAMMVLLASPQGMFGGTTKEDLLKLKDQIGQKQDRLKEINSQIERYKKEIAKKEALQNSLQNELGILENKIAARELEVSALQQEIETTIAEITVAQAEIEEKSARIENQKTLVSSLIRTMRTQEDVSYLEVLLTKGTFSEFFDAIERMKDVSEKLRDAVVSLKEERQNLVERTETLDAKRVLLDKQKNELVAMKDKLQEESSAKNTLMQEAAMSEQKFQELLFKVRQEAIAEEQQTRALEASLKDKINAIDNTGGAGSVLSWPIKSRVITTYFHDPTYPFRRLFEHSGLDIATPQGSNVTAPAPGYVAVVATGTQYGNYMIIMHPGGVSTLYAHLSKIKVKKDTYVERGDIIAASGGMPGTAGAGLSTGPHLHFETRVDGVPQNPLKYLLNE